MEAKSSVASKRFVLDILSLNSHDDGNFSRHLVNLVC